jgi:hypothetical protein
MPAAGAALMLLAHQFSADSARDRVGTLGHGERNNTGF